MDCRVARRIGLLAFIVTLALPGHSLNRAAAENSTQGSITWHTLTSPALAGNLLGDPATRTIGVYTPPGYAGSNRRYPSVYWLHGLGSNAADAWANVGRQLQALGETIVVLVDGSTRFGGSFYRNSPANGDHETYIVRDIISFVDANYRTIAHRNSRGIVGHSMGGYGALHLGLTYPRAFGVAVGINGPYDWSGVIPSDWWQRIASDPKDLNDFNSLPDAQRGPLLRIMARAAAGAANPAKAPFYFDKPYTIVDGQAQVIPDVERKIRACDVLHDLDSYVRQPDSLNAIMLVHGVNDDMVPVTQARDLSKKMKALGVVHVYEEHNLGHGGIPNTWIAFMVDNLAARRLQIFGRAPARDNAGDWDMFIHNLPGGLRMRRPGLAF